MKKRVFIILAVVVITGLTVTLIWGGSFNTPSKQSRSIQTTQDWIVAGAGRVEPSSEDIKLGAELSGKLKSVFVEEGETVKRGQILAELVNSDYQAQVESALAQRSLRKKLSCERSSMVPDARNVVKPYPRCTKPRQS
jgi:multidrug efflux pump subunit AcrA (membrane-fusion protein)